MDSFGIGAAIEGGARIYFQSARRAGRTTSLVESVKNGDRVVFVDGKEAERVKRLCSERGVKIETAIVDPKTPGRVFERGTPEGRTIFDHSWVEQYYLDRIADCQREIDSLERQSSGVGTAHSETQAYVKEVNKWRQ